MFTIDTHNVQHSTAVQCNCVKGYTVFCRDIALDYSLNTTACSIRADRNVLRIGNKMRETGWERYYGGMWVQLRLIIISNSKSHLMTIITAKAIRCLHVFCCSRHFYPD